MEIVNKEALRKIKTFRRVKIDWPELEAMVKKLGDKDMGRISEAEITKVILGKYWKPAIRAKIKKLGEQHGKKIQVVFDKSDGDCYFYITSL